MNGEIGIWILALLFVILPMFAFVLQRLVTGGT
jgi:hypothetical protein